MGHSAVIRTERWRLFRRDLSDSEESHSLRVIASDEKLDENRNASYGIGVESFDKAAR